MEENADVLWAKYCGNVFPSWFLCISNSSYKHNNNNNDYNEQDERKTKRKKPIVKNPNPF